MRTKTESFRAPLHPREQRLRIRSGLRTSFSLSCGQSKDARKGPEELQASTSRCNGIKSVLLRTRWGNFNVAHPGPNNDAFRVKHRNSPLIGREQPYIAYFLTPSIVHERGRRLAELLQVNNHRACISRARRSGLSLDASSANHSLSGLEYSTSSVEMLRPRVATEMMYRSGQILC